MACRKNGRPVMNLSSDQSDQEDQQQVHNRIPLSHIPVAPPEVPHQGYQSIHSRKQFSTTVTLDDSQNSIVEVQTLRTENQYLRHQFDRMENQNGQLRRQLHQIQVQSQKTIDGLEQELSDTTKKAKKAEGEILRLEKECQNKLKDMEIASQLMTNQRTYKANSIVIQVQSTCKSMLSELSQHKMNPAVEEIITNYVNELSALSQKSQAEDRSCRKSTRFNNHFREEAASPHPRPIAKDISDDYRMLQKSIEKLKTMERDIGEAGGNYLRRQPLGELSHNRTRTATCILSQSVASNLQRSKSKRKRIFN